MADLLTSYEIRQLLAAPSFDKMDAGREAIIDGIHEAAARFKSELGIPSLEVELLIGDEHAPYDMTASWSGIRRPSGGAIFIGIPTSSAGSTALMIRPGVMSAVRSASRTWTW